MDEPRIRFKANAIHTAFVMLTLTIIAKADPAQLLERLKDRSWPWFGDCYTNLCPDPTKNPSYCFNLRPQPESILERAGIPNTIQLTTDLKVIFSSPKEDVDVCGKAQPMEEVKAFKLPESGRAVKSLLKLGSEIYRNPPKIKWDPPDNQAYRLVIFDVGLLKYRGAWDDVKITEGVLKGTETMPYQPPANPLPVVNPILIILLKTRVLDDGDGREHCFRQRPWKETANKCREAFSTTHGGGQDIVGLQVYYTDGSSMFEKYMACAEGFICDSQCFGKFREYAESNLPQLNFMDLSLSALDMYVNIYIYVTVAQDMQNCCDGKLYFSRKDSFRARPGDNFKVSSFSRMCYPECHTDWIIEFSSTETNILGDENYYAVFAFVPWKVNDRLEVKFVWNETNIKLPEYTGGSTTSRKSYASNGAGERHMYILLFSYSAIFTGYITLSGDGKLVFPGDFKLRGISWLLFDHKYYLTEEFECTDTTRTCAPSEPEQVSRGFWRETLSFSGTTFEHPAESSPDPVVYCLEKTPPPPPPPPTTTTPPPPTTSEKKSPPNKSVMASPNVAMFACITLLFSLI